MLRRCHAFIVNEGENPQLSPILDLAGTSCLPIEETAAAERAKKGVEPLGVEKILEQDPETRPETLDRSPAPFVHATTRKIRKELWEAYGWFVAAYREAADRLRNGDRNAAFPPGSFPPHLPFVPA